MLSMDAFCYLPVKNSGTFILENLVICAEYMKRGVGTVYWKSTGRIF